MSRACSAKLSKDTEKREKAAEAITEALKQNGYYKIFFVAVLQNGRVRPDDIATMKLILNAAPITHYGVIINQLPPREYKELTSGSSDGVASMKVIATIQEAVKSDKARAAFHFVKRDEELEGAEDKVKQLPEDLATFILDVPGMEIKSQEVQRVRASEFEKMQEEMENRMRELEQRAAAAEAASERAFWQAIAYGATRAVIATAFGGF